MRALEPAPLSVTAEIAGRAAALRYEALPEGIRAVAEAMRARLVGRDTWPGRARNWRR